MDHVHHFTKPDTGFTQVPDALIHDDALTCEARIALIWMGSLPDGYVCRTSNAQAGLRWGKDRWQRVCRELRAAGAITLQWTRCKRTGRLVGQSYHWSWEPWLKPTESRKIRPSADPVDKSTESRVFRQPENPAMTGGKSRHDRRKIPPPKEERQKEGAGSAAEAAPPAPNRNDAASRREAMQPAADGGGGDTWPLIRACREAAHAALTQDSDPPRREDADQAADDERIIPPLERRRELARELLGTDAPDLVPGLSGGTPPDVP